MKKLPKSLKKYFWDVDTSKISIYRHPYFIVQRLLDKGDNNAVRWVNNHFTNKQIEDTLTKLRDFNPRVANFWALFLNIPKEKIPCLQTPYLQRRRIHWPY